MTGAVKPRSALGAAGGALVGLDDRRAALVALRRPRRRLRIGSPVPVPAPVPMAAAVAHLPGAAGADAAEGAARGDDGADHRHTPPVPAVPEGDSLGGRIGLRAVGLRLRRPGARLGLA